MKKINNILFGTLFAAGSLILFGCDESLDVNPTTHLESNYFEYEHRMQRGVGATYAKITDIYGPQLGAPSGTLHPFFLLPGDDVTFDGSGNTFETFSGLNGANGRIEGMWKRLYIIVNRTNFMLDQFKKPEVQEAYTTEGLLDHNKGEMLFIRSWAFYKLWDWWRKAPIQDERVMEIADPNVYLPPSQGFEMLDKAIADLHTAAELLPESWDNANKGRVTKNSAYGMLVKAYVLRASYNNKSSEDYGKAIEAFENISDNAELVEFGKNFDYRYENNAESLFEFQASQAPSGQDNAWLDNDFGGDVGQMGAFYQYQTGHWATYSSGIFGPTQKLVNAYEDDDPRKAETLTNNADNLGWKLWWISPQWSKFNGYQLIKYTNGARGDIYDPIWFISSANNTRLLRLADVKLAAAEAYLQTGNATEALNHVNDIRERARNSKPDGTPSAVPADLTSVTMEDIMHERYLELAGEDGVRWTDLRRWHAAGYIDLSEWTAEDFGFPYQSALFAFEVPKHLLYPIPISELDRNPKMAESGQNPGY